jgi:hypothetical protein
MKSLFISPTFQLWLLLKRMHGCISKISHFFSKYPSEMLTQRALDRAAQNIALDYKDVPIEADYVNQIKAIAGIEVKAKSKWLNALHVRGTAALINSMKSIS